VLRILIGGLVAVAVVVLIAAFFPSGVETPAGPAQVIGAAVPDEVLATLDRGSLSLRSLRGHTVLLNVWATWCGPCRREMPALERLSVAQKGRLTIVAVDQGEDAATVQRFARRFGITFPIALDKDQRLGTALHLAGLPSSFFIDGDGIVRDGVDGEMTYALMLSKAGALSGQ
jgi:thiol-disulfide isomerase/thioredoxin